MPFTDTDPVINDLARVSCEEVYNDDHLDCDEDLPHCKGCGDFLYDYTKFVFVPETGTYEPTDYCCDCYPGPEAVCPHCGAELTDEDGDKGVCPECSYCFTQDAADAARLNVPVELIDVLKREAKFS
jgi:hypothetical protein